VGCWPSRGETTESLARSGQYIDKIAFKGVDELSAIGNDAAHGKSTLALPDIERLEGNLADFLRRN
jgi:hypothetical protein